MIRIVLIVMLLLVVFWGVQAFKKIPTLVINPLKKFAPWIVGFLVLILTVTGKLNWLFALLGVLIASLVRLMPVMLNYAPQLHRLWQLFGAEKHQQQSQASPRRSSRMSQAEALEVLGLKPGADREDIIQAHRKLIARVHPDKGGSDYLAAQINLAKKVLLEP